MANRIVISWSPVSGNFVLESADSLPAANWTAVGIAPVALDGRPTVLLEPAASSKVYRLRSIP